MSSLSESASRFGASPSARVWRRRFYLAATGLFCFMFVFSSVWSFVDPEGARVQMRDLGYPAYLMYPLAVAKFLGVVAILSRRSRTLAGLAWAGFLYDLLLALSAHVALRDPRGWLAVFGLVLWGAAFWADRQRFPEAPLY